MNKLYLLLKPQLLMLVYVLGISGAVLGQSLSFPDGVIFDENSGSYLIGNTGSVDIVSMDYKTGKFTTFLDTGFWSIGRMTEKGDTMYYIDGGEVVAINVKNMTKDFAVIVGGSALSDLAADNSGNLYFADQVDDNIYKLEIANQISYKYAVNQVSGVTSMVYDEDNDRLLMVSYKSNNPIESMDISTGTVTTLHTTNLPYFSAITLDARGNIYVACPDSHKVFYYNSDFTEGPVTFCNDYNGLGDIYYNKAHDSVVVISQSDHKVYVLPAIQNIPDFIENNDNASEWKVYMDASQKYLNLFANVSRSFDLSMSLVNMQGKVMLASKNIKVREGENHLKIDIDQELSSGVYLVTLEAEGKRSSHKILVY